MTNLDRELWPDDGLIKHDLLRYYIEAAPYLLPHLRNRPLVVQRFPQGIDRPGFYQKNVPAGAPSWLKTCLCVTVMGRSLNTSWSIPRKP